ncbi:uncharacterized protein DS421_12g357330 [Arachis hypogaea]|nr:uncharacterized protein DS421_12g357330 [Arachis hypogaea]
MKDLNELESKEKQYEEQVSKLNSEKSLFEGKAQELETREKELKSQVEEFARNKEYFEYKLKELESKEKQYEEQVKKLNSEKKQNKSWIKELESREKELECQVEKYALNKENFEGQMEKLRSRESKIEVRTKKLKSKEKQFERLEKKLSFKEKKYEELMELLKSTQKQFEANVTRFAPLFCPNPSSQMAMYTALSRASSRTFHNVLSAGVLLSGETATRTVVASSLRFANSFATKTSADKNLVQVLESEIKCAYDDNCTRCLWYELRDGSRTCGLRQMPDHLTGAMWGGDGSYLILSCLAKIRETFEFENVGSVVRIRNNNQSQHVEIPDDFPFEIEDNPGERTIQLKRQYQDETIKVQVDITNVALEENEEDDDEGEKSSESSIPIPLINLDESEDQLAYEGPEFTDLDENLQKAFHKYLEIRGIKPSTTNFLQEYMFSKDNKEYLGWLKNLKNFVEQ